MIIGTAGHIDHGKTSLVKALTGIDTDRLKEEKRRGITLELGFAHLELDDGSVAGVVDVPGHERFVKAMAAGAGVIAVTKSDLLGELGEEWLPLLQADIELLTKGTFLEDAKLIACSSKTGEGLKQLKSALSSLAKDLPARSSEGPLFLPVDRAFTMKGFGTIVTGTLLAGQVKLEESISLLPGLTGPFRVRGLQVHGSPVEKVAAGQRVAVNVSGVETEQISRGMVLSRYQELPPTRMLDVELTLLPAVDTPLPKRKKLLLHLGTAQVEATVALLDSDELRPGETGFAQLRLGAEVLALPGQRFILRGFRVLPNRGATMAGGQVLTLTPPKRRKGASETLRALRDGDAEARLALLLNQAGYRGLSMRELFARSALPQKTLQRSLDLLGSKGGAMLVDKERRHYLSAERKSVV